MTRERGQEIAGRVTDAAYPHLTTHVADAILEAVEESETQWRIEFQSLSVRGGAALAAKQAELLQAGGTIADLRHRVEELEAANARLRVTVAELREDIRQWEESDAAAPVLSAVMAEPAEHQPLSNPKDLADGWVAGVLEYATAVADAAEKINGLDRERDSYSTVSEAWSGYESLIRQLALLAPRIVSLCHGYGSLLADKVRLDWYCNLEGCDFSQFCESYAPSISTTKQTATPEEWRAAIDAAMSVGWKAGEAANQPTTFPRKPTREDVEKYIVICERADAALARIEGK